MKKPVTVVLIVLVLIGVFGLGFFIGQESSLPRLANKELDKPQDLDFGLFWNVWRLIEKKYIGRENLDRQKMIYEAISGMVESLGDSRTTFMDPEDSRRFWEDDKGCFGGIGVTIDKKDGILTIVVTLEETPAKRAGLKPGDKIIKIDGILTSELTLNEISNLIRGPKGTKVILTIARDKDSKEIEIIRDVIELPEVRWELKEGNIAYIHIYQFNVDLLRGFTKAADEILASCPKGIILDLRDNPGGRLNETIDIAGWFLAKGKVVCMEDFDNIKKYKHEAWGKGKLKDFPLVVLINQGSASGAELLAAALRDNRGVKLIGETSFGKGSVQQTKKLSGDTTLIITTARWLTPKGICISKKGLEPDIKVGFTEEDYKNNRDPQLEEAMKVLLGR